MPTLPEPMTLPAEKLERTESARVASARRDSRHPGPAARHGGRFYQTVVTVAARPGRPGGCRKYEEWKSDATVRR